MVGYLTHLIKSQILRQHCGLTLDNPMYILILMLQVVQPLPLSKCLLAVVCLHHAL